MLWLRLGKHMENVRRCRHGLTSYVLYGWASKQDSYRYRLRLCHVRLDLVVAVVVVVNV